MIDQAIAELSPLVGLKAACAALGRSRSGYYRTHRPAPKTPSPPPTSRQKAPQPRALSAEERRGVLDVLHHDNHIDEAPRTVYARLLDEGTYHCSVSTMYRILRAEGEVKERRRQARHPARKKPELVATAPNQVWSWDITKLRGPAKWVWYYLYTIIDIFSRYTPGWMIATRESAWLAKHFLEQTIDAHEISPGSLCLHSDRGSSMTSSSVAVLLADLGVERSLARPRQPNDNPFSEAQFKTLKYRPDFPKEFGSIEDARSFGQTFFPWYNEVHRHSAIGFHAPADVHFGRAAAVRDLRAEVLDGAYLIHPERFVKKPPTPPDLPAVAWINPPSDPAPKTTQKILPRSSCLEAPAAADSAQRDLPRRMLAPAGASVR